MIADDAQLLIIDPQNDFCDLPAQAVPGGHKPALPVPGAHADMQRLARWIAAHGAQLASIIITLDSHRTWDIAHPAFWQLRGGGTVAPFTTITAAQVRAGDYAPRDATALSRVLAYLDALEAAGRYTLMVWPLHCEVGSWGHGVHGQVLAACRHWQAMRCRPVRHVFKGLNPWTEHYSAICAEVPDATDPATAVNTALLASLQTAGTLVIAGEAGSHCVRATCEDIVQRWQGDTARIVLLTDCISPVAGFEAEQQAFVQRMRDAGVRCETSDRFAL